jgi:hypothetical protein
MGNDDGDKEGETTRAAKAIVTAMTMAGNKEGYGKGGKGNNNDNYNGRQQREQW